MKSLLLGCAALVAAGSGQAMGAVKTQVLYSFAGGTDGANPTSGLTPGAAGTLYGTTQAGGSANCNGGCGTVFALTSVGKGWSYAQLYAFQGGTDGGFLVHAAMVLGPDGSLYGETAGGGAADNGVVFRLTPPTGSGTAWTKQTLYAFPKSTSGVAPQSNLILGSDGTLYGTATYGGTDGCDGSGCGTVFSLSPPAAGKTKWKFTVLYAFRGGKGGATPVGGVILGADGALFGTTTAGGSSKCGGAGCGTVYQLAPNAGYKKWTETTLLRFKKKANGEYGFNSLLLGNDGTLYGSTSYGGKGGCGGNGVTGCGVDFALTPTLGTGEWQESLLHTFFGKTGGGIYDGSYPNGALISGANGVLYGTTYGGGFGCPICDGTVYQLTPPADGGTQWTERQLHVFAGGSDGASPTAGLVQDSAGILYGTTGSGGTQNLGTVFSVAP